MKSEEITFPADNHEKHEPEKDNIITSEKDSCITEGKDSSDKNADLKNDKQYKSGKRIYDIGMWLTVLYLLFFAAKNLLKTEIIVGEVLITNYLNLIVIFPIVLMLIGMIKSDKAAGKYGVKKKNRTWIAVLSVAGAMVMVLSVYEIFMPSYHVYSIQTYSEREGTETIRPSQEIVAVEYANSTIMSPAPEKRPVLRYLDVYARYGVFAVKKVTSRYGSYKIIPKESSNNEYLLSVTSAGREETFPFTY